MRELWLKMSMSVDGFSSDPDGINEWMFGTDEDAKAWSVETLRAAGLHIMGSTTFRAMAAHWPTATDMFARPMNQIPKTVFSQNSSALLRDIGVGPDDPPPSARQPSGEAAGGELGGTSWAQAHVASGDLAAEIAALKAQDGGPIMAHGGVRFARSLVAQGLVDRYVLLVMPVVLGQGLSVFSALAAPVRLSLESATTFPGGAVAKIFRPQSRP